MSGKSKIRLSGDRVIHLVYLTFRIIIYVVVEKTVNITDRVTVTSYLLWYKRLQLIYIVQFRSKR